MTICAHGHADWRRVDNANRPSEGGVIDLPIWHYLLDSDSNLAADATIANGAQYAGTYKAIPRRWSSARAPIVRWKPRRAPGSGEKLTGSWYFTTNEDNAETYYEKDRVRRPRTTTRRETNYAQFGHWLVVDGAGVVTVHPFAGGGVVTGPTRWTTNLAVNVNEGDGRDDTVGQNGHL